jgi:thiol-disulfide isomerase/thioredoxin
MAGIKNPILFSVFLFLAGLQAAEVELVGPLGPELILEKIPEWVPFVEGYSPRLDIISRLQTIPEEVKVEIFLGTWCPDCRQHVSAYIKLMDMVRNPMIGTSYTGVPRDRGARGPFIEGRNVERLPTFIVSFRGKEIGRIVETPRKTVEEDLWEILGPKLHGCQGPLDLT